MQRVVVTTFYRFLSIDSAQIDALQLEVKEQLSALGCKGLVLLAPEGINGTVAGASIAVDEFKRFLVSRLDPNIRFKDSEADRTPFKRLSVCKRREIVGMKRPDLVPSGATNSHLSAAEWHSRLGDRLPKLVVDTRNRYETSLGTFRGAIDPGLDHFSEWPSYLDAANLPKDTDVLIYCTGGIRCEKAILEFQSRGYEKVYQLRDGILGYLAEFPEGFYEGECFVFDERVALDGNLAPTKNYWICPGCGLPCDQTDCCPVCGSPSHICERCRPVWGNLCSKHCLGVARQRCKVGTKIK